MVGAGGQSTEITIVETQTELEMTYVHIDVTPTLMHMYTHTHPQIYTRDHFQAHAYTVAVHAREKSHASDADL